jgi:hypothetical protein
MKYANIFIIDFVDMKTPGANDITYQYTIQIRLCTLI